jgi:hypothetical protein
MKDRLELVAALLLALAAISTAWATYQSSVWRGKQAKAQSASIATRVESTREASVANRQVQVDVALFIQWVNAFARGEGELTTFYRNRFRDEFVPAFEAWVATRPRENPKAPRSPFELPEYRLAANEEAEALEQQAADFGLVVARDVERADSYMLAVVLFAIALFFAALSTRLTSRDLQLALVAMGYVVFLGTAIWLATQPVSINA